MKLIFKTTLFLAAFLMPMNMVFAEDLIIYPAKGQTSQQMEKDKSECYLWAKDQTGVDPVQLQQPAAPAPAPQQAAPRGGVVRGAARGAAVGAIAGSFRGEVGEGAAAGAAVGGLVGGIKQKDQATQQAATQQEQQQQQAAQKDQKMNSYNKAYCACLEGRGYTVK